MPWPVALSGWVLAGLLLARHRAVMRKATAMVEYATAVLREANSLITDVYRVKLSCPECDWVDVVVREDREAALAEGNRRIFTHNADAGHPFTGQMPRPGYFRGEPLN